MPYNPPSHVDLCNRLSNLDKTSKSDRKHTIKSLQDLKNEDTREIIGAIIFESEKIYREYDKLYLDPKGGMIYSGSDLYKDFNALLDNTAENTLDTESKLKYLLDYYRFRKNSAELKDTEALDREFQPIVDGLLLQLPHLQAVLTTRPSLDTITRALKIQPKLYEEESKERWRAPNIEHVKYMQLLKLFTHELTDALIQSNKHLKTAEDQKKFRYTVYYGALLYIMKQIEFEYEGLVSNVGYLATLGKKCQPEDSVIYCFCQKALNLNRSTDIPDAVKINLFIDFAYFIELALQNKQAMSLLKSYKIKEGWTGSGMFGPTYFSDADTFLKSIYLNLENLVTQESFIWSCTKSLTNYAAQTLLAMLCLEAGALIYAAGIGVNSLPPLFGRVGFHILGGTLGAKVAAKFAKTIEPAIMANLYGTGIWYAGVAVKDSMAPQSNAIYRAQRDSKQFEGEIKEHVKNDKKPIDPLLIAIVELPCTLISNKIKNRITQVVLTPAQPDGMILDAEFDAGIHFAEPDEDAEHTQLQRFR